MAYKNVRNEKKFFKYHFEGEIQIPLKSIFYNFKKTQKNCLKKSGWHSEKILLADHAQSMPY